MVLRTTRGKDVWKPGNPCPVNFDVYYNGRIGGTITRRDGQPVSGHVYAPYQGPEKLNAALVGIEVTDGHFEITRLWPGYYRLMFSPTEPEPTPGGRKVHPEPIYYPNTQTASQAALVEVGDGAYAGVVFDIF